METLQRADEADVPPSSDPRATQVNCEPPLPRPGPALGPAGAPARPCRGDSGGGLPGVGAAGPPASPGARPHDCG